MKVSVIIPTFNRQASLRQTLESLAQQTLPISDFEIIVADDGSTDGTELMAKLNWPWQIVWLRQSNMGATAARNLGANHCKGDYLIFLDDDICPQPNALDVLLTQCSNNDRTICIGTLILPEEILRESIFARTLNASPAKEDSWIHYTRCQTGLLAVKRKDFELIGGFQDPTGGWPNWDDVDFGYRAHLIGCKFLRCAGAVGVHWDYASRNLQVSYNRLYKASYSAPRLFQKYPELRREIPMFADSHPINFRDDSLKTLFRKFMRRLSATRLVLGMAEFFTGKIERRSPSPNVLMLLYRWVLGGYIYKGYRSGQKNLGLEN